MTEAPSRGRGTPSPNTVPAATTAVAARVKNRRAYTTDSTHVNAANRTDHQRGRVALASGEPLPPIATPAWCVNHASMYHSGGSASVRRT